MRRCWVLQLYEPVDVDDPIREAAVLRNVAREINRLLSYVGDITVTCDSVSFHCYVDNVHIVAKRGCSAVLWSARERTAFANLIADAYVARRKGSPVPDEVGIIRPGGTPAGSENPFKLIREPR